MWLLSDPGPCPPLPHERTPGVISLGQWLSTLLPFGSFQGSGCRHLWGAAIVPPVVITKGSKWSASLAKTLFLKGPSAG